MTLRWRNRGLWPLVAEAVASLVWVLALALAIAATIIALVVDDGPSSVHLGFAWGIAIAVIATLQLAFALSIEARYDPRAALAFLLGPLYPIAYWVMSAAAALRAETPALVRGPMDRRVTWDIPREL